MARNGSGTYSLSASNPVAPNTLIEADWANETLEDVAAALSGSVAADGQTPMSGPLKIASGSAASPGLKFNAEGTTGLFLAGTNTLGLSVGGTERLRIGSTGSVGIGNTSPQQKLDVTGNIRFGDGTQVGMISTETNYVNMGANSNHALSLLTNNTERLRITAAGVIQDAVGNELGYRQIPRVTTFNGAARGACVAVTAGFTVPASTYVAGDTFSFYNDSASSITITQGSGLTLRLNGTATTGNRTATQRSLFTIWFNTATEAVISGGGLS